MSTYALVIPISAPVRFAEADLKARLYEADGAPASDWVTAGFTEIGGASAEWQWLYDGFPAGFRGRVEFWTDAATPEFVAFAAINPQESENADVRMSTRPDAQEIARVGHGGAVWFVSPDGDDAHSGRSPGEAFLSPRTAGAVAARGDVIRMAGGTYALGDAKFALPAGTIWRGAGLDRTVWTSTHHVFGSVSPAVVPGDDCVLEDLTAWTSRPDGRVQAPIGCWTPASVGDPPCRGVVLRRCRLRGDADALYVRNGGEHPGLDSISFRLEACHLTTNWDALMIEYAGAAVVDLLDCRIEVVGPSAEEGQSMARCVSLFANGPGTRVRLINCRLFADTRADNDSLARAIHVYGGRLSAHGCEIIALAGAKNAEAVRAAGYAADPVYADAHIDLVDCVLRARSASGQSYDVRTVSVSGASARVRLRGVLCDRTTYKTQPGDEASIEDILPDVAAAVLRDPGHRLATDEEGRVTATGEIEVDPAAIADAVWSEALADHAGAGSAGKTLATRAAPEDVRIRVLPGQLQVRAGQYTLAGGALAPLDLPAGYASTLRLRLVDADGEPVDLTGLALVFRARTRAGQDLFVLTIDDGIAVTGAEDGEFELTFSAERTATPGRHEYEFGETEAPSLFGKSDLVLRPTFGLEPPPS